MATPVRTIGGTHAAQIIIRPSRYQGPREDPAVFDRSQSTVADASQAFLLIDVLHLPTECAPVFCILESPHQSFADLSLLWRDDRTRGQSNLALQFW
jgi:hypothetical protein